MTDRAVDPRFPTRMRELRAERSLSLRDLERRVYYGRSYLSDLEHGRKPPTVEAARRIDDVLDAHGELAEMVTATAVEGARMWETADLLDRVRASDTSSGTIEALHSTVFELCCDYRWRPAAELRGDALTWLREVARLRRTAGLAEHRELLTVAGWLGLLTGCVEYDMGMRAEGEATRAAALGLGRAAGNVEIVGWAWEMSAWFALTQGRLTDTLTAARAGRAAVGDGHTVAVQLMGQEAKALARMGDSRGVRDALDQGQQLLDGFPRPDRPDHHFVVDPDKWDFYAMDAYRLAADDQPAEHHALRVLELGTAPDGAERAPMRMAEARLTLGVVAARAGELEQAVTAGMSALAAERRSLPTLLMVAGELAAELRDRYPREPATSEFRLMLRSVT